MTLRHLQRNAHKIKVYGQKYNENHRKSERFSTHQVAHLSAHSTSVLDYKDFKSFFAAENIIHSVLMEMVLEPVERQTS